MRPEAYVATRARARLVAAMAVLLARSGQMARSHRFGLRIADFISSHKQFINGQANDFGKAVRESQSKYSGYFASRKILNISGNTIVEISGIFRIHGSERNRRNIRDISEK